MFKGYNIVTATRSVFRKCATFSGRATRSEFWWFVVPACLVWKVFGIYVSQGEVAPPEVEFGSGLLCLVGMMLYFSVAVRRLHDTGRSAWNLLWLFLPFIGWIILLVYYCQDSQAGTNKYGESEKYPNA